MAKFGQAVPQVFHDRGDGNGDLLMVENTKSLEELEDLISEISEAAFFVGWLIGIEFEIWECATSDR